MLQLQFSHANGLPGGTYRYLFQLLEQTEVNYINCMGLGEFSFTDNIETLADELIATIEQKYKEPIIGIGHSAGAVATFLAAAKRPELFKTIILLEPVFFALKKRLFIQSLRSLTIWQKFGPPAKALKRRAHFANRKQAAEYFKNKVFFRDLHPSCFTDYLDYGLTAKDDQLTLTIPPQLESAIFHHVHTKIPKNYQQVQGILIWAKQSTFFNKNDAKWWQKHVPGVEVKAVEGGHLFPLEQPEMTAGLLNSFLTHYS